jgi:hypothetical protein
LWGRLRRVAGRAAGVTPQALQRSDLSGFGDASVNKSIGAHWNKKNRLNELDKAARALPEGARGNKMNVRLERCK